MGNRPNNPMGDEPEKSSDVDGLVEALRGDKPQAETAQAFSIARKQALEMLREHLLPEPERFVLLLVQAVVARGASRLDWRIDADDVELTCDGVHLTLADIECLYDEVLGSTEAEARPGLRDLALGLHSALKLEPRWVRVVSGDGETAVELTLRPGGEEEYGPSPKPVKGTHVQVKLPLARTRLKGRIVRRLPEVVLLTERCQYASVPVVVNGEDVAQGPTLGDEGVGVIRLTEPPEEEQVPGVRGEVGYLPSVERRRELRLVRHGAWVDTQRPDLPLGHEIHGFVALVEVDGLRLDLSRSKALKDDAYERAQQATVQASALCQERYDIKKLVAEGRRELVREPLEAVATRAMQQSRATMRTMMTCMAVSFLWMCGVVAYFLLKHSQSSPWYPLLAGLAIIPPTFGPALGYVRLRYGPSIKSQYNQAFPPGTLLSDAAFELLKEKEKTPDTRWSHLAKGLRYG